MESHVALGCQYTFDSCPKDVLPMTTNLSFSIYLMYSWMAEATPPCSAWASRTRMGKWEGGRGRRRGWGRGRGWGGGKGVEAGEEDGEEDGEEGRG